MVPPPRPVVTGRERKPQLVASTRRGRGPGKRFSRLPAAESRRVLPVPPAPEPQAGPFCLVLGYSGGDRVAQASFPSLQLPSPE